MPRYSLRIETTSNATAGAAAANAALQTLMPAARNSKLLAVLVKPQQLTNTQQSGLWAIDRISAIAATGSAQTPLELDEGGAASAHADTAHSASTTLALTNTNVSDALLYLNDGWNFFEKWNIMSGIAQGFALRRVTAPTGAQVVDLCMIWEE